MSAKKNRILEDFKVVSDTPFIVDDFRFPQYPGITHYFLSHFHADHYMGLDVTWEGGLIYSGETSLRLACEFLQVGQHWCRPLPFNEVCDLGKDRYVTLHDAYHCPGAAVFVFDLPPVGFDSRRRYVLHTGDFRFEENQMGGWIEKLKRNSHTHYIDSVYLDTTYCRPAYCFPAQPDVLERIRMMVTNQMGLPGRTAFVVPTYNIGKEKVVKAICDATGSKAFIDYRKHKRMRLLELPYFDIYESETPDKVFVSDWMSLGTSAGELFAKDGDIWVRFRKHLAKINALVQRLTDARSRPPRSPGHPPSFEVSLDLDIDGGLNSDTSSGPEPSSDAPFTRMAVFVPTGWTWSKPSKRAWEALSLEPTLHNEEGDLVIFRVPYSEHSSFAELQRFVELCRPRQIIPTVGHEKSRLLQITHFTHLVDKAAAEKEAFLKLFAAPAKKAEPATAKTEVIAQEKSKTEGTEVKDTQVKTEKLSQAPQAVKQEAAWEVHSLSSSGSSVASPRSEAKFSAALEQREEVAAVRPSRCEDDGCSCPPQPNECIEIGDQIPSPVDSDEVETIGNESVQRKRLLQQTSISMFFKQQKKS